MSLLADVMMDEQEGVPVARIRGEVDVSNADELGLQLHASVPNAALGLVLDLTETTYFDSSGVRLLFDLGERLSRRQQSLRVVVSEGSVLADLLQPINFTVFAPVDVSIGDAVASMRHAAPDGG
jgi:anti-anti-sigma factor